MKAPTGLGAVRALHKPPSVTVEIQRVTRQTGGPGCGHSPACLIFVPFLLSAHLFPPQYDLATVTEGGVVTYSGTFQTNGEFMQARVRGGDVARDLRMLSLERLGKRLVVEVAHAPIGADGKEGAFEPTPLASQVDLVIEYSAALAKTSGAGERGKLLLEALTWMTGEGPPFIRGRLSDPEEKDEAKAVVVASVCKAYRDSGGLSRLPEGGVPENKPASLQVVLEAVRSAPGPETAAAALACYFGPSSEPRLLGRNDRARGDYEDARPYLAGLARHVCTLKYGVCSPREALGSSPRVFSLVAPEIEGCADPARKTLLEVSFGRPVTAARIASALVSDKQANQCLAAILDGDQPEQRAGIVEALGDERLRGSSRTASLQRAFVDALYRGSKTAPGPEELEALAAVYPEVAGSLSFLARPEDRRRQASTLGLFGRAPRERDATARARAQLHAALERSDAEEKPLLQVALVVLGEREQALAAARGADPFLLRPRRDGTPTLTVPHEPGIFDNTTALIAFGFHLAGCRDEEVIAALKLAHEEGGAGSLPVCLR